MISLKSWKGVPSRLPRTIKLPLGKVDPLLSVGALEALRTLRSRRSESPELALQDLASLIRRIDVDAAGLEFASSLALDNLVPPEAPHLVPHLFFRVCIYQILIKADIRWARVITLGRERFVYTLDRDEQQCFRAAKLMDDPPDDETVNWWDDLSTFMRRQTEGQKQARSRVAERLTIEHETTRLQRLGLSVKPRWIAIEDNTAGYDVLSYEPGPKGPVSRLIEVKSSVASPLRFYVSRNEWDKASSVGIAYLFHVWDMSPENPRLYIRTVDQVQPHIPLDQEKGKWSSAVIPLAAQ